MRLSCSKVMTLPTRPVGPQVVPSVTGEQRLDVGAILDGGEG
jgi:hypothetical protein